MSQSSSSTEADAQLALELNWQLNANKRRIAASPLPMTPGPSSTFHAKAPQGNGVGSQFSPTPVSSTTAPLFAHHDSDQLSSSPLSSLSSLNDKPLGVIGSVLVHYGRADSETPFPVSPVNNTGGAASVSGRSLVKNTNNSSFGRNGKPRGITDVTVSDANMRSNPPPGAELYKMVEKAKAEGKVPITYDSAVIRLVDGKWMAPQMCESCQDVSKTAKQTGRRVKCNRMSPCSACIAEGFDCQRGTLMTLAVATKLSKRIAPKEVSESQFDNPSASKRHVRQDSTSAWAVESGVLQNSDSTWTSTCSREQPPKLHGSKRKIRDNDMGSSPEYAVPELSGENSSSITSITPPKRRRVNVHKKGGYVKYHESVQDDKPEPYGEPPVWADKRQSLCETLPYYKAYQSGAYMTRGVVKAFMCDKEVGPRDKFNEEVMIARVGGGRKFDEESGKMVLKGDQDTSTFGLGFQRARDSKSPVAVIAGQSNKLSPSKLPHYYNILDWFHVTDVWCEKSEGYKCWMVRLEKIKLDTMSWWAPKNSGPLDPNRITAPRTTVAHCRSCKRPSKTIYRSGWACLEPSCKSFFQFKGAEVDDDSIDYNEEFMNERTPFTGGSLDPLAPPLPSTRVIEEGDDFGTEVAFKTGIVCPECKSCTRRIDWRFWKCETRNCPFTYEISQKTMKVHDAICENFDFTSNKKCEGGIRIRQQTMGLYDIFEYIIPGLHTNEVIGIIRHFRSNGIVNAQRGGPNDLFRCMQENDFGLKRHAARQKGSTGEILTSHWAANWGAPYKYGVQVDSRAFKEAPLAIVNALKRLTWAGDQTVTENLDPFHPFNELLSIGYFEDTSIGYHDDGEKELGPTVATLSLGCQAIMKLRPKAKSGIGSDSKNMKGTKGDVLRILLLHGDIVVMHGSGIQKLYEHAVEPKGKLRFALTCRYIRPELLADDEERRQAAIKSQLPTGHEEYTYDGDANSTLMEVDGESEIVSDAQKAMNNFCARVHSGEVDLPTIEQCRRFLQEIVNKMDIGADTQLSNSMGEVTAATGA